MSKRAEDAAVTQAYLRRITGYEVTEEKREYKINGDGEAELVKKTETVKHVPGDPRAAEFWLKNRQPKMWKDSRFLGDGEQSEEGGVIELPPVEETPDG